MPDGYRARAFSVMQSGMSLLQGIGVLGMGVLTGAGLTVPASVGVWGLAGTGLVVVLLVLWPSSREFDDAVAEPSTH